MALQIKVLVSSFKDYSLVMTLKCWNAGDNPDVDDPVVDIKFARNVAKQVDGLTEDQVLKNAVAEFKSDMQEVIDKHKKSDELLKKSSLEVARDTLEKGLVG